MSKEKKRKKKKNRKNKLEAAAFNTKVPPKDFNSN